MSTRSRADGPLNSSDEGGGTHFERSVNNSNGYLCLVVNENNAQHCIKTYQETSQTTRFGERCRAVTGGVLGDLDHPERSTVRSQSYERLGAEAGAIFSNHLREIDVRRTCNYSITNSSVEDPDYKSQSKCIRLPLTYVSSYLQFSGMSAHFSTLCKKIVPR